MSLADDIAAAYRSGDYGQVQNWINSSGASANDIQSQFNLNAADMSWLTNNIGLNIPGAAPAAAPAPSVADPVAAPVAAPAPAASTTPGWLTGANQWLSSGNTGTSGGSYYDQATNKYIMPVYGQGGYNDSTGDYASGALTGWNAYDRLPGNNSTDYSNTPFTSFDSTGKQTGTGQFGEIGGTDWIQRAVQLGLIAGGGAVLGNAVGMFGAPGAGSAGTTTAATTGAGSGSGSGGLYSLAGGAPAPTSGLGLSTTGGGLGLGTGTGTGITAGQVAGGLGAAGSLAGAVGGSGTGLQAAIGNGLDLYKETGGGLGLKVTAGDGLNLIKEMGDGLGLKLTPEAISNWTTIGKSLEGLGATEAIKRLTDSGLMTKATGTNTGVTINNNNSGGAGLNDLMGIISGIIGSVGQNKSAGEQRQWLDKQMSDINKLYAPGSPEHELLKQEMERKDAAAGRNSQYGPRATDLAAKIAEIKARNIANLAGSTQGNVMNSITADKTSLNSLLAALGKSGPSVTNVSSLLDLFK